MERIALTLFVTYMFQSICQYVEFRMYGKIQPRKVDVIILIIFSIISYIALGN